MKGCGCVVTFDAYEAMFRCNQLRCVSECLVALRIPFPFFTPCDDMHTILVCITRWLSMHLHTLAYMSMHESCLLVCCPCFNTMKLQTYDPNLHLSFADSIFFLLLCLFFSFLIRLFACFLVLVLATSTMLICFMLLSYVFCIFSFPLLVNWFLVFTFACTHIKQGRLELGHGLPGTSKKGM